MTVERAIRTAPSSTQTRDAAWPGCDGDPTPDADYRPYRAWASALKAALLAGRA